MQSEANNQSDAASPPGSLANMEGLDYINAIARVGDCLSMYHRLLAQWMEGDGDFGERVRLAWQSRDFDNLIICVHSLKGSSGNLGAMNVSAHALEVEHLLRFDRDNPRLEFELEKLIAHLDQFFTELTKRVTPPQKPQTTQQQGAGTNDIILELSQLAALLDHFDTGAIEYVEQYFTRFDAVIGGEEFDECYRLIHACDFAAATEILRKIIASQRAIKG